VTPSFGNFKATHQARAIARFAAAGRRAANSVSHQDLLLRKMTTIRIARGGSHYPDFTSVFGAETENIPRADFCLPSECHRSPARICFGDARR
jgi:hypothetical protein